MTRRVQYLRVFHLLLGAVLVLTSCETNSTGPAAELVVTITNSESTVEIGAALRMTAAVSPATATQAVTWSSSDESLARIDAAGNVTALLPGSVTITATSTSDPSRSASRQLQITGCPAPRTITGNVNANATWQNWIASPLCLDYVATSNIEVDNAVLTIEPGTNVGFDATFLRINSTSTIVAAGTAQDPIRLTRATAQASWRSLTVRSASTGNRLEHLVVEYAGVNPTDAERPASLVLREAHTTLISVTVRESAGYGMFMRFSTTIAPGANNIVLTRNASGPAYVYASAAHFILGAQGANLTGNTRDVLDIEPDPVVATGTWHYTGVPYRIAQSADRLALRVTGDLSITAGVALVFEAGMGMRVQEGGRLRATGSATAPVLFTGSSPVPGHWMGLVATQGSTELDRVIIEYGGGGGAPLTEPANLMATTSSTDSTRVRLTNSVLRNSGRYGFYARPFSVSIQAFQSNTISANASAPAYLATSQVDKLAPSSTFAGNGDDRVYVSMHGESVAFDGNATWRDLGVPYRMVDDAGSFIISGQTLTLEPGVEIQFAPASRLWVREGASLVAMGTEQDPIRINGVGGAKWRGIGFSSSTGTFEHFHIADGGSVAWNLVTQPANVTVMENSFVTINRPSSGSNAQYGVAFDHSSSAYDCTLLGMVWVPLGFPLRDNYPCFGPGGSGL